MNSRTRLARFTEWVHGRSPLRVLILVAVGAVAFLAAIAQILQYVESRETSSSSPPPPPSVTASSSSSGPAVRPVPSAASGPRSTAPDEECLTAALVVVSCHEPHRYQAMAESCDSAGLLRFMGGIVGLDVVAARPRKGIATDKCVVDAGREIDESAADVLTSDSDDSWRQCVDNRQRVLVSCDQPHTGEYFSTPTPGRADTEECRTSGEQYLQQSVGAVATDLRVVVLASGSPDPSGARCLIEVRNTQLLTASLARLGVGTIPLQR